MIAVTTAARIEGYEIAAYKGTAQGETFQEPLKNAEAQGANAILNTYYDDALDVDTPWRRCRHRTNPGVITASGHQRISFRVCSSCGGNQRRNMTPTATPSVPKGYNNFLAELKERIRHAQLRAALSVNRELILLYWSIGRDILAAVNESGLGSQGYRPPGGGSSQADGSLRIRPDRVPAQAVEGLEALRKLERSVKR